MTQQEKEIIERLTVSEGYLSDWYQASIDETKPPVWTDAHLNEIFRDFYLIPKPNNDTFNFD